MSTILSFGGMGLSSLRESKGKSLIDVLDDYTALDLETTGLDPRFNDIIEIGAVRVRDGVVVDRFETLVNPEYEIDEFITELTGITNEMLATAPVLKDVLPKALDFIGDDTVIAHNANFDVNFMYDSCSSLTLTAFCNNFIDTVRMSRRLFPQYPHHRLVDITQHFGIPFLSNHRASADAEAAHMCYAYMKRHIIEENIDIATLTRPKNSLKASDITTDITYFDEGSPVFAKVFTFTGVLEKMNRKDAMQMVVDMGGLCGDRVTKNTNYLVLGNNDYCSTIKDGKSTKQKKAEQLKLMGCDIEILSEDVFYDMISVGHMDAKVERKVGQQESLFAHLSFSEKDIFDLIQPTLLSVLERNHIRGEHLSFKRGQSYSSIKLLSSLVFRICARGEASFISVSAEFETEIPSFAHTSIDPKDNRFIKIYISDKYDLEKFYSFLAYVLEQIIDKIPKDYDCCSRYLSCSDALHCVHPDWDYSMQCGYKRILKRGICYFGVNRNID